MAGALQAAQTGGDRIRRLQNGSYIDTATGKRYASYKDIPQAHAQLGDPAAMRASIRSNMGPSTATYDTSGAPDVLDTLHGNTDILGALGATPVTDPADQIPMAGASVARNPQAPQGALSTVAPQRPLAAGPADSTSPIPMVLPSVRGGQAAHNPGAGGALQTPDQEASQVLGSDAPDLLSSGVSLAGKVGKGALGKVPPDVTVTPGKGNFSSATAPSDFASSGPITDATNSAGLGALGAAYQPKPIDVTGGLAALTKNPTSQGGTGGIGPVEHDPSWMERIGGAIGLRKDGPSTSGSGAFDGLFDDPDRTALLEAGLGTMAAAGQPGATLGGALGQGGLGAIHNRDVRQERADKTKEENLRLDREMARYDADRAERAGYHRDENNHWVATNERETNRDKASASQALVTNAQKDREIEAAAATEAAREKDSAALRGIEGQQANTAAGRETREAQAEHDKGYTDTYHNYLESHKTNSNNSVDALLNPVDATRLDKDASWQAATKFPKATQSKTVAQQTVLEINAAMKKNGGVMPPELRVKNDQARAILQGGK